MTDVPTAVVPAGWHVDPSSPTRMRWWTGDGWSEHTAPLPADDVEAPAAEGPAAEVSPEPKPKPEPEPEPEPEPDVHAEPGYGWPRQESTRPGVVVAHRVETPGGWDILPSRWSSVSVWIIAFSPFIAFAAAAAASFLLALYGWSWWILGAVLLPYLVTIVFAVRDVRRLRIWGHQYVARASWSLLGAPVYLIARAIVTRKHAGIGAAPAWAFFLNVLIVAAGCVLLAISLRASLAPLVTDGIEESIAWELSVDGTEHTVDCGTPDRILPGATLNCTVTDDTGATGALEVRIDNLTDGFSYSQPVMSTAG